MYPDSFLWWLGGTAIIFGILGLVFMLAWFVDNYFKTRHRSKKEDEDGASDE